MAKPAPRVLAELYEYDSFLDSLTTIADMGCGTGEDITWWATLMTRDDPPEPHNYVCFAVDKDGSKLAEVPDLPNIHKINKDFTDPNIIPRSIDLMWAHDSLQYSHNPLETLKHWNQQMTVDGMLVLCVPQDSGVEYNRYYSRTYNHCFYHYTPTNLIYMLAVNGFDCRDAYLLKKFQDPWIHVAVYKSKVAPMDPKTTTWTELIDKGLLHPTIETSVTTHGFLKQEEILMPWLDKENYFIDWVPQYTEIPKEAGEPVVRGVFNRVVKSDNPRVLQAEIALRETKLSSPVGIMRPPKRSYSKK